MRIISFAEVIKQLPEDQHSFSIKKTNWTNIKAGFDELANLKEITYSKGPKMYYAYLKEISSISKKIGCSVGQLEMFLFIFGSNLKEKLSTR